MGLTKSLTVAEILKLPQFKHSKLLAGKNGLGQPVSWVHVLEHVSIKEFVNGNELVLTTGARWKNNNDPLLFLDQLIEKKVSALCIQLGSKYNQYHSPEAIPLSIIRKAEANNFPLLVFPEDYDCRFIDLIHDVHSMIMSRQYEQFMNQEEFLDKLYQILLNVHDISDVLSYLHSYLDLNVAFLKGNSKPLFIPKPNASTKNTLIELVNDMLKNDLQEKIRGNLSIACRNVNTYESDTGTLVIYSLKRIISTFEKSILDKCAANLSKLSFENLLVKEKERYDRDRWVKKWIAGEFSKQEVEKQLQCDDPFYCPQACTVCLVSFARPFMQNDRHLDRIHRINSIARSYFELNGFKLICYIEKQSVVYVLTGTQQPALWKGALQNALQNFFENITSAPYIKNNEIIFFSVGEISPFIDKLKNSYESAQNVLYIQNTLGEPAINFYEDIAIYQVILLLDQSNQLESFVYKHLHPLLRNKPDRRSILLDTLITLRDCQYNKIEAAGRLFISRQSIYQRIKTLESLLGSDFLDSPQNRLCIETALYGLHFLDMKEKRGAKDITESTPSQFMKF